MLSKFIFGKEDKNKRKVGQKSRDGEVLGGGSQLLFFPLPNDNQNKELL